MEDLKAAADDDFAMFTNKKADVVLLQGLRAVANV